MPMDAATLLARCKVAWPALVDLSKPQAHASGGVWFPVLADINRRLELKIDVRSGHWLNLGAWA